MSRTDRVIIITKGFSVESRHSNGLILGFKTSRVSRPGGGGGVPSALLFGRGCEAEASKPVPIFKGHFGRKGAHY